MSLELTNIEHICKDDGSSHFSYVVGDKGVGLRGSTTKQLCQAAPKNSRGLVEGTITLRLEAIEINFGEDELEIE